MELNIEQYETLSPLSAYLEGKTEDEQHAALAKFAVMDNGEKEVLAGTSTAEKLLTLVEEGTIPQTHGKAVAKLIAFILLDNVPLERATGLLKNLGLSVNIAERITSAISDIVQPVLIQKTVASATMPEVPPLSTSRQSVDTIAGPQAGAPGVVDLRRQDP